MTADLLPMCPACGNCDWHGPFCKICKFQPLARIEELEARLAPAPADDVVERVKDNLLAAGYRREVNDAFCEITIRAALAAAQADRRVVLEECSKPSVDRHLAALRAPENGDAIKRGLKAASILIANAVAEVGGPPIPSWLEDCAADIKAAHVALGVTAFASEEARCDACHGSGVIVISNGHFADGSENNIEVDCDCHAGPERPE